LNADQKAIAIATLAIFLLTVMDALIKGLSSTYSAPQIMLLRASFGFIWAVGVFLWFRPGWPQGVQWKAHILRTCIMLTAGVLFFHALGRMPLAELFVYTFTAPIFVALFGSLLLREHLTRQVLLGLSLGFGGMVVIVATDPAARFGGGSWDGLAAALLSPIVYALAMVLLRKQAGHEPVPRIVFVQQVISVAIFVPLMSWQTPLPQGQQWIAAIAIGLLGTAGNLLLAMAFSRAEAAKVGVAEFTGLIWAALIGYAVFHETPRAMVWIGGALVITGCIVVLKGKPRAVAPADIA
jgi:drug/metabolite transporter (DMT)-like permease